ncbi:hypothetical protein BGZ74_010198 [Mortierella antarctica]|nr:hypothetical protein BGZ74_010198 [Mortierella antarctica]
MHDEDEDEEIIANSTTTGSNNEHDDDGYSSYTPGQVPTERKTPRPMRLKTLKLKRVRMQEQHFLRLLKHCSLLEEIDVYSTMCWSWSNGFLDAVKQYCPSLRHLHLTTNYVIPANNPQPNALGSLVIHETQAQHGSVTPLQVLVVQPYSDSHEVVAWDPVGELIKKFPNLLSYNARYVQFQDRTLLTLQQHCQRLETLDLTSCREVSSKSLLHFLQSTWTLRHLFADRVVLRIEDMISSDEQNSFQTLRWTCENLETLVIGIKNPECTSTIQSTASNDLQVERTSDLQFYYRQFQGSSSSRSGGGSSTSTGRHGDGYGQSYNHIQLCTYILFQQIGRLRKLRRLELHGGRLELGIKPNPFVGDTPLPSSDQGPSSSTEKKSSGSSRGFVPLTKIRSFLSKGSGKAKQANSPPAQIQVPDYGKGKTIDQGDGRDNGGDEGDDDDDNDPERLVPDDMIGLLPLTGLDKLKSFALIWSNFPKLLERDVAWMCEHWTSLEWISLGMVCGTEWSTLRSWIRSRRPEIAVIFEQH